jgi:hypothetical protein
MKKETKNPAGGPGSVKQKKRFNNPYINYSAMDKEILRKIQAEHGSPFLADLAGRIANRLEGRAGN